MAVIITTSVSRDECVRRIRAAGDTHFARQVCSAVRVVVQQGSIRLTGRYGGKSFFSQLNVQIEELPDGCSRLVCMSEPVAILMVFWIAWFGILLLGAALALAAAILQAVLAVLRHGELSAALGPLAAFAGVLVMALFGIAFRAFFRIFEKGEQKYFMDALRGAIRDDGRAVE